MKTLTVTEIPEGALWIADEISWPPKQTPIASIPVQVDGQGAQGPKLLLHEKKYSVPKAAKLLGISETNLRIMIKRGEISVIQILPTKVVILESELEKFLQRHHVTIKPNNIKPTPKMPVAPDFVVASEHLKKKAS